jgi:uncharacterized membrane-anchored protein
MIEAPKRVLSKVPEATLGFWIIKIAATTLGETGGDEVSMTLQLGYAIASTVFLGIFFAAVLVQISARSFHPLLYWTVIVASTTAGTTMADFADRSLGIGYTGGAFFLVLAVMASLGIWYWSAGSISIQSVVSRKAELFYWITIILSQGDWTADSMRWGYEGPALVFAALLAVLAALYFFTKISRTFLFWSAFILTRPLGATVGDFLDKPVDHGGMAISRLTASALLAVFMVAAILLLPQRAAATANAH